MNPSGINPTEYKVLVKPKPVEAKIGSIIIPVSKQDSDKYATVEGRIVAASPLAFTYASEAEWAAANAVKPKPGDAILYAKYAGVWIRGKDGQEYLLINDKDICALIND